MSKQLHKNFTDLKRQPFCLLVLQLYYYHNMPDLSSFKTFLCFCQIKDKTGLFFNDLKDKSGLPENSKKI